MSNIKLKDDGGPAFPRTEDAINHRNRDWDLDGMSLRDYFAAKAMQAIIIGNDADECVTGRSGAVGAALDAYNVADAMLVARKK